MIEREENHDFVDRLDEIEVIYMLVEADLQIAEDVAEGSDDFLNHFEVLLVDLVFKQADQYVHQYFDFVVLEFGGGMADFVALFHYISDFLFLVFKSVDRAIFLDPFFPSFVFELLELVVGLGYIFGSLPEALAGRYGFLSEFVVVIYSVWI